MKIAIHQPEHMPWLGFFKKIDMADVYVVLDNVQYRRRYFQNRNKIRTANGWQWVIVPLEKERRNDLLIKDAVISNDIKKWEDKNIESIYHNYCKAKYFNYYWNSFKSVYCNGYSRLIDLNIQLLNFFSKSLNIERKIVFASELGVVGKKSELMFNICQILKASTYISGISGRDYLDINKFNNKGIKVVIQEFHHPIYKQLFEPFISCMSILDLLFNYGERSIDIINGVGVSVMQEVFL